MRYLVLVPDGAGDNAIDALGGKTPLQAAHMPVLKGLGQRGMVGRVKTIPEGVAPGSDAANLGLLGYDPAACLTGRAALEAASMGVELEAGEVAYRANTVTLVDPATGKPATGTTKTPYEDLVVADYSAGEITDGEGAELIEYLTGELERKLGSSLEGFQPDGAGVGLPEGRPVELKLYPGVSYRNLLVLGGELQVQEHRQQQPQLQQLLPQLTPPQDIIGKPLGAYLPQSGNLKLQNLLRQIQKESYLMLREHPLNKRRSEEGLNPANGIWLWGPGTRPNIENFTGKFGLTASCVAAVDLIRGIAISAGMEAGRVEGATGRVDTNYAGKAEAALEYFKKGKEMVYLHLEGPDECSHQGDLEGKVRALELMDREIAAPIVDWLEKSGEPYRLLAVPDHRTPVALRNHDRQPVPYLMYDSSWGGRQESRDFPSAAALAQYFFGSTAK